MTNAWVEHVKRWASDRGLSYGCAVSMEDCKREYRENKLSNKSKEPKPPREPKPKKVREPKPPKPPKQKKLTKKEQLVEQMRLRQEATSNLYKQMAEKINKKAQEEAKEDRENITMTMEDINRADTKKKGRPRVYATMDEAKKAKVRKTLEAFRKRKMAKELGRIEEKHLTERESMGAEDINRADKPLLPTHEAILKTLKKRGKTKIGKGILKEIKNVVSVATGNIGFTAKTKSVIDKHANSNITAVKLHRTPLGKTLMSVLNVASGNTLKDKIKNSPYDKLFHLFMCIETTSGNFSIEKNEVINADASCKLPPYTETRTITNVPDGLSVAKSLENTKAKLGDKFLSYEASNNNCQHFVTAFLEANHIGDSSDIAFVKQDTDSLFEGNPVFKKIVNSITKLGSTISNLTGSGVEKSDHKAFHTSSKVLNHLVSHITDMKEPVDERDFKQAKLLIDEIKDIKSGGGFEDFIKSVGATAGKPYEISGINPFTAGYNLGHDVIAPELMKVLPPEKVKKSLGGRGLINKKSSNSKYMANKWIEYVKEFSKKHNCSYREALRNPECKAGYKKGGGVPTNEDSVIAVDYDSKNLGVHKKSL
jgi:hypothetical protein